MKNLDQLIEAHLKAKAAEEAAYLAIEGEGTDAQWDAFFNAQDATKAALNAMLSATCNIALGMIKGVESRNNVRAFFELAALRDGDAREKAIQKAYELATISRR